MSVESERENVEEKALAMIDKGRRSKWWRRSHKGQNRAVYHDASNQQIKNKADLDRIKALVIPPAWRHVRINPSTAGKIQVVGMDAAGRVQYRYHPSFSARQQRAKFARIEVFGELLPKLRIQTNKDITSDGLTKDKVIAVVMRLINSLYFRVGTDLSARQYRTFGITTLQKRHLTIGNKGKLTFEFAGKSHVQHRKMLVDEELAAIIKELSQIKSGRKLFRYIDLDGKAHAITPAQINGYIKSAMGAEYSSKDFRTWGATVLAASGLAQVGAIESEAERKRAIVRIVKNVAQELGNTPTVCRTSYIHPVVWDAYTAGITLDEFRKSRTFSRISNELEPEEKALLRLFKAMKTKS